MAWSISSEKSGVGVSGLPTITRASWTGRRRSSRRSLYSGTLTQMWRRPRSAGSQRQRSMLARMSSSVAPRGARTAPRGSCGRDAVPAGPSAGSRRGGRRVVVGRVVAGSRASRAGSATRASHPTLRPRRARAPPRRRAGWRSSPSLSLQGAVAGCGGLVGGERGAGDRRGRGDARQTASAAGLELRRDQVGEARRSIGRRALAGIRVRRRALNSASARSAGRRLAAPSWPGSGSRPASIAVGVPGSAMSACAAGGVQAPILSGA